MLDSFALLVVVVASVVVVPEAGGIVAGLFVFSVNLILTSSVGFCLVLFDVGPSVVCSQNKKNIYLKLKFYFSLPPSFDKFECCGLIIKFIHVIYERTSLKIYRNMRKTTQHIN